jgi:hypothetical protein
MRGDRRAIPVIAVNILAAAAILAMVGWLLVAEASSAGQRPDQGPARGAISSPTAAYPR